MADIFNKICVLVTAAFALTLVPGFRRVGTFSAVDEDQGTKLLVFLLLGLVEEATVAKPAGSITVSSPCALPVCWQALMWGSSSPHL